MSPENISGDNTPEKQPPIDSGEITETSKEIPKSFFELGIQPGSVADTTKEQIEFLASLSDQERSKAEEKLGRPLDEGGAFRVRITAKDGSRPPREGLFEFSHFQNFLGKKEQNELSIRNPEQPTTQKTEIARAEPKKAGTETADAEGKKTPKEINKTKKELEEKHEESDPSKAKESPDQKAAREMIESGQNMSFEDLLRFSLEVYKNIKDSELRDKTYSTLSEMAKQKSQERLQKVQEGNQQVIEDFKAGKITKDEAAKKLGFGKKKYSWEKKKRYPWEK